MECTEPGAVAGPGVQPASHAVLMGSQGRGQHSGAWKVRAPKGPARAGGGRHRRQGQRGGGDARGAERAASPVRDPGPPASASSSSARVASPGMAWPCARPSVRVRPCVCPVEPVRPPPLARGMGGGQWMTSAPPRPLGAPSERARARQALRSGAQEVGAGGGSLPSPGEPSSRLARPCLSRSIPPTPLRGKGSQSAGSWTDPRVASPFSRVGKRRRVARIWGAGELWGRWRRSPPSLPPGPHLYGPGVPAQPDASIQEVSWRCSSALIGRSSHVSLHDNHLSTPWQPEPVEKDGPRGSLLPHPSAFAR